MSSTDDRQDEELVGDEADYDEEVQEFYDQHADEVCGYLRNVGTPTEHVESIVNDAFLAARLKWKTLRTQDPRAYVFKVARNQRCSRLRNDIKRNQRTVSGLPIECPRDPPLAAHDHADAIIDRLTLQAALAALPERPRDAVNAAGFRLRGAPGNASIVLSDYDRPGPRA